ncbi:hypothetical protein CUMW_259680 [Citrus unshiu]|uniref:Uncharacterized protein n=1 Tax=Citrus unshiu TaxID=55188 RepID=A0A2H5QT96_CITUN|nr:hypothetical protein CUMW_259680 [Citrus unshiu]
MATPDIMEREQDFLLSPPLLDPSKGEGAKSRGMSIEKKIEFLESLTGNVILFPNLQMITVMLAIDGLEGDKVPPSPFCMTNYGEWDKFRNIDMDKEVVLPSAKSVTDVEPQFDQIRKCPGSGIIVSGLAPPESGFDFYSRFFCPKFGINEDPVCGSAHCALATYWSQKLGKCDFVAYAASPRSGILNIHVDKQNQRVQLRGKAITVMEGSLFGFQLFTFCNSKFHVSNSKLHSLFCNMAKKLVQYSVVDAFTDSAFKGNPAAVCLLEEDRDEEWLQAVASEFNTSQTGYLTRLTAAESPNPRFRLRWFTPVAEVELCGHATLAAAHTLFSRDVKAMNDSNSQKGEARECYFIELDFPTVPTTDFNFSEANIIKALNGSTLKRKVHVDADKIAVLNAWCRIGC